jgi:ABC-2 type transport system ATP-binding protein
MSLSSGASPSALAAPAVQTVGLRKAFGPLVAVEGLDLAIPRGQVFGLLGPNGSGKTTTIRMLCGLMAPTAGTASVVGHDIVRESEAIRRKIGYMSQRYGLYDDLTVYENVRFYGTVYGLHGQVRTERIESHLKELGLTERRNQLAGTLSGGWKQRLALACATAHEPEMLFLDEPTAGVDPAARRTFWETIYELAKGGTTILVTTHYMDEAARCHRLAFIFRGAVLDTGTPDEVVERRKLRAVELDVVEAARAIEAADLLRAVPAIEEVEHYGNLLRAAARGGADPVELARRALEPRGVAVRDVREVRITVEDAFVSMVRDQERDEAAANRGNAA